VRELNGCQSHATGLHPQHAAIQVCPSISSTNRILLRAAAVLAIRSLGPLAAIADILDQGNSAAGACLLAQLTEIGVDQSITSAHGLSSHGYARWTGSRTVAGGRGTGPVPPAHLGQLLLLRLLAEQGFQGSRRRSRGLHQRGGQLGLGILAVVDQQ